MDEVRRTLHIGYANWDALLERIEHQERDDRSDFADQQVWTFLLAATYAMGGPSGAARLASLFIENDVSEAINKIWFECLPVSPRLKEGNTHLDLAVGGIAQCNGTSSGIQYARHVAEFICFCECKWYSDISIDVTYDKHRNQLARTIENALCFQGTDFPTDVHVTLVTPDIFKTRELRSRLYQYKLSEYIERPDTLLAELRDSCLPKRNSGGYSYPTDLPARVSCLKLHWVSFQSLIKGAPESALKAPFAQFVERFDGSAGG